jgi:hypothetical protein
MTGFLLARKRHSCLQRVVLVSTIFERTPQSRVLDRNSVRPIQCQVFRRLSCKAPLHGQRAARLASAVRLQQKLTEAYVSCKKKAFLRRGVHGSVRPYSSFVLVCPLVRTSASVSFRRVRVPRPGLIFVLA